MSMGHDIVPDHLITTEEADAAIEDVIGRRQPGRLARLRGWWRWRQSEAIAPARRYVLGFVFDHEYHHVLLIEKRRPEWQKGRLNGLGGKIAEGESPAEAMERELREETKGVLGEVVLVPFARLVVQADSRNEPAFPGAVVWIFHGKLAEPEQELTSMLAGLDVGEGVTRVIPSVDLPNWPTMPNLRYLVPMAVNHARGLDAAVFFEISEAVVPPEVSG